MNTGDIILIPFPFSDTDDIKVRPSVLISITNDKYKDLVVSAITSVVPSELNKTQILVQPDSHNNLRADSIIRVDRIVTLKAENKIANIGRLSKKDLEKFKEVFKGLVD